MERRKKAAGKMKGSLGPIHLQNEIAAKIQVN
jgi:hypothetical protein